MKKTFCLIAKLCNYLPFLTPLIIDRQAPTGVSTLMHFIDIKQWVVKCFIFIWLLWIELIGRPKTKTGLVTLLTAFQTKRKTVWSIYLNQFIWLPSAFISWADLQLWLISRSFIPLEWLQRAQGCPSSRSQLNQKVIQLNRDWAARGLKQKKSLTSVAASIWDQCYISLTSVNNGSKTVVLNCLIPVSKVEHLISLLNHVQLVQISYQHEHGDLNNYQHIQYLCFPVFLKPQNRWVRFHSPVFQFARKKPRN